MASDHPTSFPPRKGGSLAAWLTTVVGLLLRGVLALSALVWLLLALVLGTVLGLGLWLAGLLRGRRPDLGLFHRTWKQAWRSTGPRPTEDLVIDVQVREVPAKEIQSGSRHAD